MTRLQSVVGNFACPAGVPTAAQHSAWSLVTTRRWIFREGSEVVPWEEAEAEGEVPDAGGVRARLVAEVKAEERSSASARARGPDPDRGSARLPGSAPTVVSRP